ncbi:hypothetical protein F5883DRAFT_21603 [Diaporthe sp. PMI_573]|nr:hypothetical protein F5883DRAFT_21603 [Diaporthaceae sp. PMI_573]
MRLLRHGDTGEISFTKDLVGDDPIPPYAILSHTWQEGEEVTFKDLTDGTGRDKAGYNKIWFCGQQAECDGLHYFWVDTCCIDKSNSGELREALNSMFRWYQNAEKCYVYLSDVSTAKRKASDGVSESSWEPAFRVSRWFTRGWTLQELLAPGSVEFFSQEWKKLGDKRLLMQQVHKITGIPESALQGAPLSQFSINERLSWIENRQTKLEEDRAYSLLGILSVYIPPLYGEGMARAFKRLMDEIDKRDKCIQDLRLTDPCDDKKRIEETNGGLLKDSYRWILENSDFHRWRNDTQSRLLWIKGDPGKGKTMLLCGIINELSNSMAKTNQLSYFFCQATDSRINNATAVLRGLLYLIVNQQPSLVSHIRKKHDHAQKALFEDANAWVALSEIFINILQDPSLNSTYLIVDALDECVTDLPKLLDFIMQNSSASSRIKWMVTCRNEVSIEQRLQCHDSGTRLSLELKENAAQVSYAVDVYIDHCLSELPKIQHNLRELVREKMQQKAGGTFLWVSLVIKELKEVMAWEVLQVLDEVPTELKELYRRMMRQIERLPRQYPKLCRQALSTVVAAYRPLQLQELHLLSDLPTQAQDVNEVTIAVVKMCGSFLTIREGNVYVIHQSARDFLFGEASHNIFPCGTEDVHQTIFSRSLQVLFKTLRRDMYSLCTPGYPAEQVKPPDPDPLAASRYSCIYWVDHLCDWNPNPHANHRDVLQDRGIIDNFVRKKYLYWLESLSICRSMSEGLVSMAKLEALVEGRADASALIELVRDARRFIRYHKQTIENSPLQAYASALVFSPTHSLIRCLFKEEEQKGITIKPAMGDKWSPCLQTLEGHSGVVTSAAFSHDSTRLASASHDETVKIWDASSGGCLRTLKGHKGQVTSVAFSHDSTRLVSASSDETTVKIWDASSGNCLQTLEGYSSWVLSVAFSHDSARLALALLGGTVGIWNASSGDCLQTLEGHSSSVNSVTFSHDSARLASGSDDETVKIWNASSGDCLQTLKGHSDVVTSVAFSHDSTRLASASSDKTVKIWDASNGAYLQTFKIGKVLHNISFDTTGSYLHTEIGAVSISATPLVPSSTPTIIESQHPKYQGLALSADGTWITHNSENLVWLPLEYRPSCSAMIGKKIGIGVANGRVWICQSLT